LRIGLDLDNTIINYVPAFSEVSGKLGLGMVPDGIGFRDVVKSEGPEIWQNFQSVLYTDGLAFAEPAPGVIKFLRFARENSIDLSIVSHKTPLTPTRFGGKNLRLPALRWLESHRIVPELVSPVCVHFCTTRAVKLSLISQLNFDWFIDDLARVLDDRRFPEKTVGFRYSPDSWPQRKVASEPNRSPRSTFSFSELLEVLRSEIGSC
jgi:hypothetical protein